MSILRKLQTIPRRKIGLTTLFSGLVSLSVVLTLTILLVASYKTNKQALIDTTLELNYSTAAQMSQTIDSLFKSMRGSLQYSADFLSKNSKLSDAEIQERLEFMKYNSNYFNSVAFVDETGMFRSIAPSSIGTAGQPITSKETIEALSLRKPYLSKPYISPTGRLIVFMSEPLFDKEGNYHGYIGGTIYLQESNIMNMIFGNDPTADNQSYSYVVGSNGHLLYHPDKSRVGEDVSNNPIVQKLLQGGSGNLLAVNSRGLSVIAGYSSVRENGWGVVVQTPFQVVYDQLNRQIEAILLYTLPPFVILMLGGVWLSRRLAKPFVSLADLAGKIGRGEKINLPEITQHWNREADLLTRTFKLALTGMREQTDQLTLAAMTDPLTGLTNRRTLESIMNQWIQEQAPFCILIMDIDRFKSINDTFGHQVGDEVLKHLAKVIASCVRPADLCCRYGGEEFVVLVPEATAAEAYFVAERIRTTLETSDNPVKQPVTVSLGIAHFPSHAESHETLFHLADQALYKAKETGRNRTIIAG